MGAWAPPLHCSGARVRDRHGNEWVSFDDVPVVGHAHPKVVEASRRVLDRGVMGVEPELEAELAALVGRAVPSIELLRSTSSGEAAVLGAMRLARHFSGRVKILCVDGGARGYGGYPVRYEAGGDRPFLGSAGPPPGAARDLLLVPWGDLESLCETMALNAGQIAAVVIEPCLSRVGVVPPPTGYLKEVRELASAEGALLILDETITGWRTSAGSLQTRYGVRADLTCLGLPCHPRCHGLGGRFDVMSHLEPKGVVAPMGDGASASALAAALATLELIDEMAFARIRGLADGLEIGLEAAIAMARSKAAVGRMGTLATLFLGVDKVPDGSAARQLDGARHDAFRESAFARRLLLPASQQAPLTLSLAHDEQDVAALKSAVEKNLVDGNP